MRILVYTTSTNNCESFIGSLLAAGGYEVSVFAYDEKWQKAAIEICQKNPSAADEFGTGRRHIPRDDCAMDDEMLREAKMAQPDAIVYISAWQGDFIPFNETLGELNSIAPLIHFLSDGQDPPWWAQLREFERRGIFSATVNIDGGHYWPGGMAWDAGSDWKVSNALTLLTPVDTRLYPQATVGYEERPYAIGYAGNIGGHFRQGMVSRMRHARDFHVRERSRNPNSYAQFADFLRHCRISINTPFTGSGVARQVKGRVLESGFAGCTLLEWANEATARWFTPRHHYWEYNSVEECAEYSEWLSAHPRLGEQMARALEHEVRKEHAPHVFWQKVFAAAGK